MRIAAEFDCDVKSIAMHKDDATGSLTLTPKVSVLVSAEACALRVLGGRIEGVRRP